MNLISQYTLLSLPYHIHIYMRIKHRRRRELGHP